MRSLHSVRATFLAPLHPHLRTRLALLCFARARVCVRPDAKHLHVCLCLCAEEAGLLEHGVDHVVPVGERFRATVLGLGGSQHPMDVFKAFRGREPSVDALLRHNGLAEVEATAEVSG
jgi:hypothetical protein